MKLVYFLTLVVALLVSFVLAVPVPDDGDHHGVPHNWHDTHPNIPRQPVPDDGDHHGVPHDWHDKHPNIPRQDSESSLSTAAPGSTWDNAVQTLVGALYPIITGLAELASLVNVTDRDTILQQTIRNTIQPVLNLLDDTPANQGLAARTTEALCRPHPCPLMARAAWNYTTELCECPPLHFKPLEPEPPTLADREIDRTGEALCRPQPCPGSIGARAVWNSTLKLCECAPLHFEPIEPEPPTLTTRSVLGSCHHFGCPLGAQAFWDPKGKTCMCPTLPKLPIPHHPATVSKNVPFSETKTAEAKVDTRDELTKRGLVLEVTAGSLTLPNISPRLLIEAAHMVIPDNLIAKPKTPAKNRLPPPKLARRDTTATAANPMWTPEGLDPQFLKDVAAFQAASFQDKAKFGPKFRFKTLNRVDHGFPPAPTSTQKVKV
ncbi:MAG: hypothetical protein M1812_007725 [Candelaria pacifica]|nr:MAG: hypothetical protein M1812_007725 [Candelaria pacifica]